MRLAVPLVLLLTLGTCARRAHPHTPGQLVTRPGYVYVVEDNGDVSVLIKDPKALPAAKAELCAKGTVCLLAPAGTVYVIVRERPDGAR